MPTETNILFSIQSDSITMAAEISASNWKNVEVGRIVLLQEGPYAGRLATIVEIIDHKRVRAAN